jgi:hypothetical protein
VLYCACRYYFLRRRIYLWHIRFLMTASVAAFALPDALLKLFPRVHLTLSTRVFALTAALAQLTAL